MEHIPGNDPMFNYLDAYHDIINEMKREMASAKHFS